MLGLNLMHANIKPWPNNVLTVNVETTYDAESGSVHISFFLKVSMNEDQCRNFISEYEPNEINRQTGVMGLEGGINLVASFYCRCC